MRFGGCSLRGGGQQVTTQSETSASAVAAEAREGDGMGGNGKREGVGQASITLLSAPLTSPPEVREWDGKGEREGPLCLPFLSEARAASRKT